MRKVLRYKQPRRVANAMLTGAGANTYQDRGATQAISRWSSNPYNNNNFIGRWQEYVKWYMTSWEARKIIDIPIDDAFRETWELQGLPEEVKNNIDKVFEEMELAGQLKRALKQERLLGGSVLLAIMVLQKGENLEDPLREKEILPGDLQALNVIDVTKLSRPHFDTDPFSPHFDKISHLSVQGVPIHTSRMCVFDGDALFNYSSQTLLQNFRYNPCGFGESKLTTLYDLLVRAIGTQQAAYQLVNLASVLLIESGNLRTMQATDSPALDKLEEIIRQISVYQGAIVDIKDAKVTQHAAQFGSVPELILTYAQLLAAASDIPATRFLGKSPDGLTASGISDSRNYYDMVNSIRETKVRPAILRVTNWLGLSLYGGEKWRALAKNLTLNFPSLWSPSALEQAQTENTLVQMMSGLYSAGIISAEAAIKELRQRKIFSTNVEAEQALEQGTGAEKIVDIFDKVEL